MTNPHPTDDAYARDVANFTAAQAVELDNLRIQTADKPAHAALLHAMLDAPTEDAVLELAEEPPSGCSLTVADALADDVTWARFATPPRRGWFTSGAPRAYREHRIKTGRAAADRARTIEARARYADSLEGRINLALTPRR